MNKSILGLLLICIAILNTGCNFLKEEPYDPAKPKTYAELRELLTNAYLATPNDRGLSSFRSDETDLDATMSLSELHSFTNIWGWVDDSNDNRTDSFGWDDYYRNLIVANNVIKEAENFKAVMVKEANQLIGEAYLFRAYTHFLLANLYAPAYTTCDPKKTDGIPLKLDDKVATDLKQNTLYEVYNSIIADIKAGEKLMNKDRWAVGLSYRFTKPSAQALLSRVLLYMGDWQGSLDASKALLAQRNELADLTKLSPSRLDSPECIVGFENIISTRFKKAMRVSKELYNLYTPSDLRKKVYFNTEQDNMVLVYKGGEDVFLTTLRVGEVYLNAAEAACRLGLIEESANYLSTLQKSRYSGTDAPSPEGIGSLSQTLLLEQILLERRKELAFEGHRWFDLRRCGQPRIEKNYAGTTYVLEANDPRYTLKMPANTNL